MDGDIDRAHFEIHGHVLFPELATRPDSTQTGRNFRQSLKKLERESREAHRREYERKAAEHARLLAKQKAKEEDEFYLSDENDYFTDPKLRAKVLKSKVIGLLELPPEILTNIIEYCSMEDCGALRLVHPQLAYLQFLKRKLFNEFTLTPDPAKLYRIVKMSDSVAPFVSVLWMRPILISRANNPWNYSDTKVKQDLKPAVDAVMTGGKALSAWTEFLRKVRPGLKVVIKYLEWENTACFICAGPAPQTFMQLAAKSLAESACRMGALDFQHYSLGALVDNNIPRWDGLHLQRLERLNFSFTLNTRRKDEECLKSFSVQCAALLRKLMQGKKIQELNIDTDASCLLERGYLPDLPYIRHIKLRSPTVLDPVHFSTWLSSLPSLRQLKLYGVRADDQMTLSGWKPIFDAIRNHPGKLFMHFDALIARPGGPVNLYFDHQVGARPVKNVSPHVHEGTYVGNAAFMICNHLSDLGEWNVYNL